ncbi:MAG TPA: calcium-binding protein [Nocardioides sp.]|nr:calcium-binding protein [Nocardioides sp.]
MRRTTPLTAAALLGLTLMAPTSGASAAEETCQGRTATIVGTPHGRVVGTPGDDVIVTYGDYTVDAGDGDDLICVRPVVGGLVIEIDAGAGDDSVVSEGETNNAFTDLGPGRDSYVGGGGEDRIEASLDDTIVADSGDDFLNYSIARGEQLPAVVGTTSMSRDEGWIKVTAPGRRLTIDGSSGRISLEGQVVTTFAVSPRMLFGVAQRVVLVGTPGFDRLGTAACGTSVIRGRGAGDQVVALGDRATPRRECRNRRMLAIGGGGDDSIQGTKQDDVLRGGSGKDTIVGHGGTDVADGGPGRDRCDAEQERRCER